MIKIDGIKDVEKLMRGEHESQTRIQVSVPSEAKDTTIRNVGDRWTDEDGNEWEQKEGYKLKLGKDWQQELHQHLRAFPNCQKQECTCTFPNKLDEKMKALKGLCFDCVITMEHRIKLAGKWDEYENGLLKENALSWLREAETDKVRIAEELSKVEFVNEFGDVEKWDAAKTKEELLQKIDNEFEEFKNNFIKAIDEQLGNNTESSSENQERNQGDT